MIINENKTTFNSNMTLKSASFGIKNMSKIFDILQNKLYSNKKQVIAQEYMCNGRDATRELQKNLGSNAVVRPIEVMVPSVLSLFLKVRDFGPGISEERMYDVFINYGATTKDDTNEQTGGFGLGAKSAFSYTSSFQITTFIEGVKTVYLAHVNEKKEGKLSFISQEPTDEVNGTEISIPILKQDITDFCNAVTRTSYFWKESERPVIKNMGEVMFHDWNGYQVGDVILSQYPKSSYHYSKECFLIIDGIIYPMDGIFSAINKNNDELMSKITTLFNSHNNVMFQVPNGFVEVGASRERVEETKFTFDNLVPFLKKNYLKLKADFDKQTKFADFNEAVTNATSVSKIYDVSRFTVGNWKLDITNKEEGIVLSSLLDKVGVSHLVMNDKGDLREVKAKRWETKQTKIYLSEINKGLVLHFEGATEAQLILNRKVKQYLSKNNAKTVTFLRFNDDTLTQEVKDEVLSTLKAVSVANLTYDKQIIIRAKKEKQEVDKSLYALYQYQGGNRISTNFTQDKLDEVEQIVYVPFEELSKYSSFSSLKKYYTNTMFVGAIKSVLKKLQTLPNAVSFEEWEKTIVIDEKDIKGYIRSQLVNDSLYNEDGAAQENLLNIVCQISGITASKITSLQADYEPYRKAKLSNNFPSYLENKISSSEDVKKVLKNIEEQVTIVKETYPLLKKIDVKYLNNEQSKDLVSYLNSK